ncbi:XRE family transcriptional regulator [Amycolatopsis magusensis]|uniref:XRE family transcriptional regulator n=1 Tax=Amycolatopsis magusensis TaxID=882444 RepID=UPI0024A86FB2|nr:XRE family transcriptional regulator [Amycolatopsis magusensis]MDI5979873.1 XRE family transcriptional regulator [Amycolatopsis magusensis]
MSAEPEGTFATVLRAAISTRGLPLDRIRDRLSQRGHQNTTATLSYWQSGRSQPQRRGSLAALRDLEDVLGVPGGSLSTLLGPPRPRGRRPTRVVRDIPSYWPVPEPVAQSLEEVDPRWDARLTRLSQHDDLAVGPRREELVCRSRQVLRAEVDGPDRWVLISHIDEHDRALPILRAHRNCRVGEVVHRPEAGLLVAELVFDRPLRRGETVIIEHSLTNRPPCPLATNYERKFRLPVREYVVEISFDPLAVPGRCVRFSYENGLLKEEAVPVAEFSVHAVALDFGPGRYGFRWEWPGVADRE